MSGAYDYPSPMGLISGAWDDPLPMELMFGARDGGLYVADPPYCQMS